MAASAFTSRLRASLTSQRTRRTFLRLFKASLAAVLAWVVSDRLLGLPVPSLAPWAALLTAQATVYRSVRSGMEQTVATVGGVLLAFAGAYVLGNTPLTLGVLLLVGLLLGRLRFFTDQPTTLAVSALFVLTLGYVDQQGLLLARVGDVVVGVVLGVLVNVLFVPPLAVGDAEQAIGESRKRIADLLQAVAGGLREGWDAGRAREWFREAAGIDDELRELWSTVTYSRESTWWNPRRRFARLRSDREARDELVALEQVGAELRSMVRALWGDASDRGQDARDEERPAERTDDAGPGQGVGGLGRDLARCLELLASLAQGESPAGDAIREELDELLSALGDRPDLQDVRAAVAVLAGVRNAVAELSPEAARGMGDRGGT